MDEMKSLTRDSIQLLQPDAGAVEMQHVNQQAEIGAIDGALYLKSFLQGGDLRPGYKLQAHREAGFPRKVAKLRKGIDREISLSGPDAGNHAARSQLGPSLQRRQISSYIDSVGNASEFDIVKLETGAAQRGLGFPKHCGIISQIVIGFVRQAHGDDPETHEIVTGARRDFGHFGRWTAEDRQVRQAELRGRGAPERGAGCRRGSLEEASPTGARGEQGYATPAAFSAA